MALRDMLHQTAFQAVIWWEQIAGTVDGSEIWQAKKQLRWEKNEYEHIAHCFSLSFCQRIMMDHVQISIYLLPIKQGMTCYDTLWWK